MSLIRQTVAGNPGSALDVLLIEDDRAFARIVERYFRKSSAETFAVDHSENLDEGIQRLGEGDFSLILTDLGLDDSQGLETIERLTSVSPQTPLVVLTANVNTQLAFDAMKAGAQDYLIKGQFDSDMLVRVSRYAIERQKAQDHIAYLAHHDALTGLPNRMLVNDRLRQIIDTNQRRGLAAAVHFVDLDRFKQINDTLGHVVGDELLREVADRLNGALRRCDTIGRIGGDEFVVIQTDLEHGPADAQAVAEKIIDAIRPIFSSMGFDIQATATVGTAIFPDDGATADDLLRSADLALNVAKQEVKGSFRFFNDEMRIALERRRSLESDLRKAMQNGELELFYQPKFALNRWQTVGAEALIRWHHPADGMISPDQFIPIAEESGLIGDLGEWIIRQACRDAARFRTACKTDVPIAVNLSPLQLQNPNFADQVESALEEAKLPPELLELEITETATVEGNVAQARSLLEQLRRKGVSLAIDDFGTGYASLSQLLRFPFTSIKIDRSFVRQIGRNKEASEIVRAIVSLGRGLDKVLVAEGIETKAQAQFLIDERCQLAQGYLYGRPVEARSFISHTQKKDVTDGFVPAGR